MAFGTTGVAPTFHRILVRGLAQSFAGSGWIGSQPIPLAFQPVKDP